MNQSINSTNQVLDEPVALSVNSVSFWRRFFAFTIDLFILGLIFKVISLLGIDLGTTVTGVVPLSPISLAVSTIYFIVFYSTGGQTPGKKILGIRVISINGSPLDWKKGVLRSVGYLPSTIPLYLGFLWSIWDADRQAWHDKLAGTRVVKASFDRELLAGRIDLASARSTQKKWLVGMGILTLIFLAIVGGLFYSFVQRNVAEVKAMGPWPNHDYSPQEIINIDLTSLGLESNQIQDARAEGFWSDGGYDSGNRITFSYAGKDVVYVWALQYDEEQAAGKDFAVVQALAQENCGFHKSVYMGNIGVVHCGFSEGFEKFFWNGVWIVHVIAGQGTEFTPDVLVDGVRDEIAAHWKNLPLQ